MRQTVKYPAVFALILFWVLGLGAAATAEAQEKYRTIPGPLMGGSWGPPPERPPVEVDPSLPTGAELATTVSRPKTAAVPPACSSRRPVCAHGTDGASALAALGALENAYERLVFGVGLPAPLSDWGRGGSDALDLYLVDDAGDLSVGRDAPAVSRHDQASAFCSMPPRSGMLVERAALFCVAEAIAWRLDASESPHARRAFAAHLWSIVGYPTSLDAEGLDDLQANPQVAIGARRRTALSEASSVFFEYLDTKLGNGQPGALAASMLALSAGETEGDRWEWNNEPDLFDVLRHTFDAKPSRVADVMIDFAVERAFLGDRDDGTHLFPLEWTGSFGRVRFDWVVAFSSLPRTLAPLKPIDPTGSTYIWVDLDEVDLGQGLGFRAEWEAPVAFKWTLVTVDRDGKLLTRVDLPFQERGSSVEGRLVDVSTAAGVLVAGTNLGGVTLAHPFDPDMDPFEPHEYTVLLARL